jgi:hypothetical protein
MSKYRISGRGFGPFGPSALFVPGSTVITTDGPIDKLDQWSKLVVLSRSPPPSDAQPLDDATYAEMAERYGAGNVVAPPPPEVPTTNKGV